jgi:hypothetical protein
MNELNELIKTNEMLDECITYLIEIKIAECNEELKETETRLSLCIAKKQFLTSINKPTTQIDLEIKRCEHLIKIMKIELLIYKNHFKKDCRMYKLLLEKFQETLTELMEIVSESVRLDYVTEEEYMLYAKRLKKSYEFIEKICKRAERLIE